MRVGNARTAAAEWVNQYASREEGFIGAYFSGSTVGLPDDAELPVASDVDVVVVTEQDELPLKLGKFLYAGALLEITHLSWSLFGTPEKVLSSYHLAGSFRVDTIIADPTGQLAELQRQVALHFAERPWVRRRCEEARQKIENGLRSIDASAPLHDQVTSWLFPTGVTTHVILVAALRNPTVRLRYLAARSVLMEYGQPALYMELLELLGCAQLSPRQVEQQLAGLTRTFDAAAAAARTPFMFSSDITAAARPVAIEGSQELIRSGRHCEAVFWIVATYARCHKILAADAPPELQQALLPDFEAAIADLGISSAEVIPRRAEAVIRFLPRLWESAETIISANPDLHGN
ncbi:hypothetical protein [Paenibacillus nasutitermitis]|uniref:Nucleotidyltransferase domain-containing protein n=1 Tax=Paenibacillus nasutitermitis TaxID=1652958 RepID=A0A916Z6M1_9BACL|nr:hypothetical protein [Paenibacillus nasutitermitis]GGD77443.1 hypothetical protein GCM10010911_39320 [Paenibacillus nasutitermitis]